MQIIKKKFELSLSACFQICLGSNLHDSASNITIAKIIYKNNCAQADQSVICHRTLSNVDSCKNNGVKWRIAKSFCYQNKINTVIPLLSCSNFYTGFAKQFKYYKCLCWLWYCLYTNYFACYIHVLNGPVVKALEIIKAEDLSSNLMRTLNNFFAW